MVMQSLRFQYRGIGLLELMLTLIVITAILFAATRYYRITSESARVERAVSMTTNIVNATHQWAETVPNLNNLSLQKLVDAQLIPYDYLKGNPWGGALNFHYIGSNTFQINMNGILPGTSCESLREKMQKYVSESTYRCQKQGNGKYTITMSFQ